MSSAQTSLFPTRGAEISACGRYRYHLWRRWSSDARIVWVMLNPSDADANDDDPTMRKCIGFSRRWGYGSLDVVNLFAWRTPYPEELPKDVSAVGPANDDWIGDTCAGNDVIVAWGAHPRARERVGAVLDLLFSVGAVPYCLGRARNGAPRHPLMLSYGTLREALLP